MQTLTRVEARRPVSGRWKADGTIVLARCARDADEDAMATTPNLVSGDTNQTRILLAYSLFLTALGTALLRLLVTSTGAVDVRFRMAWPLFFILMFLAESYPVRYHLRSTSYSVTLTEIPLVLALLSEQTRHILLIAGLAVLSARIFVGKGRGAKLACNTALTFFEHATLVAVYQSVSGGASILAPRTWLAIITSIALMNTVGNTALHGGLHILGERFSRQSLSASVNFVASSIGLSGLVTVAAASFQISPLSLPVLAAIAAIVIFGFIRYSRLRQRYESLHLLHGFISGMSRSHKFDDLLDSVLAQLCDAMGAVSVEIVLLDGPSAGHRRSSDGEVKGLPAEGDWVWVRAIDQQEALLLAPGRADSGEDDYLSRYGIKDVMVAPLTGDDGVIALLAVCSRSGGTGKFTTEDRDNLMTIAKHVTVAVQNSNLISRLGQEMQHREHQALHDALTNMANRTSFARRVAEHLDALDGSGAPFGVGIIDLNRFKEINDTLGHDVGDELLQIAAQRISSSLPPDAFAARLGDDEFAVLFANVEDKAHLAERAKIIQQAFVEPFGLRDIQVPMDVAAGFALAPDDGRDQRLLLKRAEVAMYAAKEQRTSAVALYHPDQERSSERQLGLVTDLRRAIDHDQIIAFYQPKADLRTGAIVGAEALVRWNHDRLGWVRPDEFIPLAEHTGLIGSLTSRILQQAIEQCAVWRSLGHPLTIAVNISHRSLEDPGFATEIASLLWRYDLPADALTLEVTERGLVQDAEDVRSTMRTLRDTGVRFSIDDFGTGYSSLSYLARLHVNEVKIDRSFVKDVLHSASSRTIVSAVVQIARSLDLTTVAEGIEDRATWDTLSNLGCDNMQGYVLSPAVASAAFLTLISQHDASMWRVGPALARRSKPA